jgi:S-(hydroxymethyl)glutathione dehydrogenase/alcohol dehydrogenase
MKGAKLGGAKIIIALDILDTKESIARQFGATHFINPSKLGDTPLPERIKAITNSLYVDFAFEATGNTTVLQTATKIAHPFWGTVVAVGIPNQKSETTFPAATFAIGRTVKGVYFGNSKPISAGNQILQWYLEKKIQIKPLITHRITLKVINANNNKIK